jgi:SAM-dependent methyltransferase
MANAVARFAALAPRYDAARPLAPAELADMLRQWAGTGDPDVVDVGAGTGLSTVLWIGRARAVTAIEPGEDMRAIALRRLGLNAERPAGVLASSAASAPARVPVPRVSAPDGPAGDGAAAPAAARPTAVTVAAGSAEATGLPDECADIVTASQALHWFDPARALPEIARVLRPGGVFAAYDYDWPPCIDWETDAAFAAFDTRVDELETERDLIPPRAGKRGHLERIAGSGLFRHAREVGLHSRDQGDAERIANLALSQGGAAALLAEGATEDELGLTALRQVAARRLATPRQWWWTYRVRIAVK